MSKLFLGDEDFDHIAVGYLLEWGYDVVTIQDLGLDRIKFPDEAVLQKAIDLKRVLLTHNRRHFIRLHARNDHHFGIIVCTQSRQHKRLAEKIVEILEDSDEIDGQLIKIYRDP